MSNVSITFRLFRLRSDARLNQEDIANLLGINRVVYCYYENGKRSIPLHHLIKLANFYNVSLDYLVGRSDIRNFK